MMSRFDQVQLDRIAMSFKKNDPCTFLPTTRQEMDQRNWEELDVLFINGDAYVDHPAFGVPLLARLLESKGFRVGIISQPDWKNPETLTIMGRPRLFAAISAGAMDSMVNHYTAARKIRRDDAYTPGGMAGKRPNRAVVAYTSAVKGAFKGLPTIIGGIEASLRRLAHYDYWDDKVRRSVLIDSKADLLLYGMAETALLEITQRLATGKTIQQIRDIRGTAFLDKEAPEKALRLPSYEQVEDDVDAYGRTFRLASEQDNPYTAGILAQQHAQRFVIVNPPALPLTTEQLDEIYALPFCRAPHPSYREKIPAYTQIRHSITSHRGCFGGCAFCAITHHQGKFIQSRSQESILNEIDRLTVQTDFHGTISDIGGPTANMYGLSCNNPQAMSRCRRASCLYPQICPNLNCDDQAAVSLLKKISANQRVRHVFIASGIRYDLLARQRRYFDELIQHHISGLLKVAPESTVDRVTDVMRKPGAQVFIDFLEKFRQRNLELGLRQALVPYLISGHPGCTLEDMLEVALFLKRHGLKVEQVQDFTPTPGSLSTCIFHTGKDPYTNKPVHIPRSAREKRLQKALLLYHLPEMRNDLKEALRQCGKEQLLEQFCDPGAKRSKSNVLPRKSTASAKRSIRKKR